MRQTSAVGEQRFFGVAVVGYWLMAFWTVWHLRGFFNSAVKWVNR